MSSIVDRITTPYNLPPYFRWCFFAEGGVGKTVLAAQAPGAFIMNTESVDAPSSIMNHPEIQDVQVVHMTRLQDFNDLYMPLRAGEIPGVQTLIIDTGTSLQGINLREIMDKVWEDSEKKRNRYLPSQAEYKWSTDQVIRLLISYSELPYNLILTAHETTFQDEITKKITTRPALTDALSKTVVRLFSIVGHLTMETAGDNVRRELRVHPTNRIKAKTRVGGLPPVIQNPKLQTLIDAYNAQRAKAAALAAEQGGK